MKMAEMTTKYLEYYINLVDKAAAGFERSDSQFYKNLYCGLEKAMAPHSSTLAWKKSHGRRSLVGYSPWGHEESDMTE